MHATLKAAALAALLAGLAPGAAAQSDQRIVVPLSAPGQPARLEVSLVMGTISVTGYDGDEVIIVAGDEMDDEPEQPERNGLRRIPNTSIGLTAEERANAVSVAVDWINREIDLAISVPRGTSVRASTVNGGDLTIEGVTGEHELSNVNGGISATDVAGSVVANTTNGDVHVSFTELTPAKAMSFTSFNGDVEVSFPPDLAADLRINAGRGEVLTDFDVNVQAQAPVVDRSGNEGRYRVRVEREVRAIVGAGGPEMHFKTFNGDIVIRRR